MTPLGARLVARWALPDHGGLTSAMLDRAVALGLITEDTRPDRGP